uniref:BHLH domain-containing protein n=1 Tax=Angiostrongylus cantonensis TaxID=6313 RepID=A0A0K0DDI0_ANGCA
MSSALPRPLTVATPLRYCHHHCSWVMQPKVKLTPRKIGVQGPSIRRKEPTKMSQFSREELSELKRLSAMLPPRAAKEQDPAQLVLNAANYIQQLVATVRARVNKGTLPIVTITVFVVVTNNYIVISRRALSTPIDVSRSFRRAKLRSNTSTIRVFSVFDVFT